MDGDAFVTVTWTILGSSGSSELQSTLGESGFSDKMTTSMGKQEGPLSSASAGAVENIQAVPIPTGSHFSALIFSGFDWILKYNFTTLPSFTINYNYF